LKQDRDAGALANDRARLLEFSLVEASIIPVRPGSRTRGPFPTAPSVEQRETNTYLSSAASL